MPIPQCFASWKQRIEALKGLPKFSDGDVVRPVFDKIGIMDAEDETTVRQSHKERFLVANATFRYQSDFH